MCSGWIYTLNKFSNTRTNAEGGAGRELPGVLLLLLLLLILLFIIISVDESAEAGVGGVVKE